MVQNAGLSNYAIVSETRGDYHVTTIIVPMPPDPTTRATCDAMETALWAAIQDVMDQHPEWGQAITERELRNILKRPSPWSEGQPSAALSFPITPAHFAEMPPDAQQEMKELDPYHDPA